MNRIVFEYKTNGSATFYIEDRHDLNRVLETMADNLDYGFFNAMTAAANVAREHAVKHDGSAIVSDILIQEHGRKLFHNGARVSGSDRITTAAGYVIAE